MNTTTDKALDALEARIMENAHDRWYVTSRSETLGLNVETCVANPGLEDFWVLIWVTPERAEVKALQDQMVQDAWEMSVNDLLQYLHTLPRPIRSFGARNVFDKFMAEGE